MTTRVRPSADANARADVKVDTASGLSFAMALTALAAGAVAMGVSPVFVRLSEVGPFASAFWRAALALPPLFIWLVLEARAAGRTPRDVLGFDGTILLCGLFFAGDLFFWHLSIMNTTIANATLLSCLAPVWVVLLSGAFIGEPVGKTVYLGLVLCLIGTALLIGFSYTLAPERFTGDLYGLITSVFFGLYILAVRVARRRHAAGALTFKSTVITALVLLVVTVFSGQSLIPATLAGVAALLALGIISHTGGQGLLAVALGSLSAAFSSLVIFIEALAAALFGWLVFSETLDASQMMGGILILAGIRIAGMKGWPRSRDAR